MNITYLIGNGFDLNLGLKTGYSDFLEKYKEIKPTDSEIIKKFKQDILKDEDLWSRAEEQFGKYTQEFDGNKFTVDQYCECHEDFCANLAEYLKSEEKKIKFASISEDVLERCFKSLNNYTDGFGSLITKELPEPTTAGNNYCFINFNYTQTLDNLLMYLERNPFVHFEYSPCIKNIHVHGLCDGTMVLGVNDKTQISNIQLFDGQPTEYLSQIMKPMTYEITEVDNDDKVIEIIRNSDLIYIYGMSLGLTDLRWWEEIIATMLSKPSVRTIIHVYDSIGLGFFKTKQKIMEKKVFSNFFALFDNVLDDINIEYLKKRIYITSYNIFNDIKDLANYNNSNEEAV